MPRDAYLKMKIAIVFGAVLAVATAAGIHDGLVAKWAPAAADDALYSIPRTRDELASDVITWVQVKGDAGDPFTIHCEQDNERYCVLYDNNGFIAGEQYSIPDEDIVNNTGGYDFSLVSSYRRTTRFNRNVWTGTAFFVNPDVLVNGGRTDLSEGSIVELWLQRGDSYTSAVNIPLDRTDLETTTNYLLCNCLRGMGVHYYTEMYEGGDCAKFDPWFLMYSDQVFVGLGFQGFGSPVVRPNIRHYNEDVPRLAINLIVPNAPQCFLDNYDADGPISLHTFFVADPLGQIRCNGTEF